MRGQNVCGGARRAGAVVGAIALAVLLGAAGQAHAASGCKIIGTWTDLHSGTAHFKSNKLGSAIAPNLCSAHYVLKVTTLTSTSFDLSGTSKDASCPSFTAALTFKGTACTVAAGEVTVANKGSYHDVWTKSPAPHRAAPTSMRDGLK